MTIHVDENFVPLLDCRDVVGDVVETGSAACAVPEHGDPHVKQHKHSDRCVECQMDVIEGHILEMRETLDLIKTTMLRADTTIATIAGEVKPTLDALTANPAVRMFLGVKKDKG